MIGVARPRIRARATAARPHIASRVARRRAVAIASRVAVARRDPSRVVARRVDPRVARANRAGMPFQIYVAGQRVSADATLSDAWRAPAQRAALKRPNAAGADGDDGRDDQGWTGTRDDDARAKRAAR